MAKGPSCFGALDLETTGTFTEPMLSMVVYQTAVEGRGDPHVCNLKEEEEEGD